MLKNDDMVTIKETILLTGKSESTIRKMLINGELKGEKIKEGRLTKVYINKRELLNTFSKIPQFTDVKNEVSTDVKNEVSDRLHDKMITLLETENERLKRDIERLNGKVEQLQDEIRRLNEEMKALLREKNRPSKGIFGYLVERITK